MPAMKRAHRALPLLRVATAALLCWSCSKKKEPEPPPVPVPAAPAAVPAPAATPPVDTTHKDTSAALTPKRPRRFAFASKPAVKAYSHHPYAYKPAFSLSGPAHVRIVKGPDSMTVEKGALTWMPGKAGDYAVTLEAAMKNDEAGAGDSLRAKQSFSISVAPILVFVLKPLPAQVNKGDTVTFDLRGSAFPAWAAPDLSVRFDYDGDGQWDTPELPLGDHLLHKHAYMQPGRFAPKVEAHYRGEPPQGAEAKVAVRSAVEAVLKISPDTAEPGGPVNVDASATKGDGRLVYRLDLDGDGNVDWADSASGKGTLTAPATGVYEARLTVTNPMGERGQVTAKLRVNAKPKIDVKAVNPRDNMAAAIIVEARARDADDSIRDMQVNFTGEASAWEAPKTVPDSAHGPHVWFRNFSHVYGKVGRYKPVVCMTAGDGRRACKDVEVEIFNAPPVCPPQPILHATLGVPIDIEGIGVDPDGKIVKWEWDLNGDGKFDMVSSDDKLKYTFAKEGKFSLGLRVTTADGMTATGVRKVEVRKKWKS